jgi:cytochrome c-type biogenesis protein CcmH/NrfF
MLPLTIVGTVLLVAVPSSEQSRPANVIEQQIMHDLACTCATCNKEPIDECACPQAVQMRAEVKQALYGRDLSTAQAQSTASAAVRSLFAKTYGDAVLTPRSQDPRLSWLPLLVFVGGFLVFVLMTRRSLARRRAQKRVNTDGNRPN